MKIFHRINPRRSSVAGIFPLFLWFSVACLPAAALEVDFTYTQACAGAKTYFYNNTTPPDSVLTALWDLDTDGQFDDAAGNSVSHIFSDPGIYSVGIQIITLTGDLKALYKMVAVGGVIAGFTFDAGCRGQPIRFANQSVAAGDTVNNCYWHFGDGSPADSAWNPVHVFHQTGSFMVTLTLNTTLGCSGTATQEITILPRPEFTLEFLGDTANFRGDTLMVIASGNYDSLVWSDGTRGNVLWVTQSGSYFGRAYKNGCFVSREFSVTMRPVNHLIISTLFTPNGDGFNDFWIIRGLEKYGPARVMVLDQFGNLVYSNDNYQNQWDGRSDTAELPSGAYYYVVQSATREVYKGMVNILR